MIWLLFLLLLAKPAFATESQLAVTAKVPLSSVWKESLERDSSIDYRVANNIITFKVDSIGPNNSPVAKQKVAMKVFLNDRAIGMREQNDQPTQFEYLLDEDGKYRFIFYNRSYDQEFRLQNEVNFFYSIYFNIILPL